jgi:hypothetical protein
MGHLVAPVDGERREQLVVVDLLVVTGDDDQHIHVGLLQMPAEVVQGALAGGRAPRLDLGRALVREVLAQCGQFGERVRLTPEVEGGVAAVGGAAHVPQLRCHLQLGAVRRADPRDNASHVILRQIRNRETAFFS